jgi:hypothetical protein
VRDHRVVDRADADAELHVAYGFGAIAEARRHPGVVEVAHDDPRSEAQVATYDRLRTRLIDGLRDAGQADLVPQVDANLFGLNADPRFPPEMHRTVIELADVPQPLGVFTWDPSQ